MYLKIRNAIKANLLYPNSIGGESLVFFTEETWSLVVKVYTLLLFYIGIVYNIISMEGTCWSTQIDPFIIASAE